MGLKSRLFKYGRKTVGKENEAIPPIHRDLGEGYYFAMDQKRNGFGGYATVNIGMYRGEKLIRQITDTEGSFLDFPGVEHGKWEDELKFPFQDTARFVVRFREFGEDGLAEIIWMVQPDGRYWADDDGFGMENDMEIELCAKIDKTGQFVTPFSWNE
ncbi:MAG: hypothetical protein LUD01_04410 [Clostridiales bacterium]|nr:hypothetical protein [Clostridiales bacterium]